MIIPYLQFLYHVQILLYNEIPNNPNLSRYKFIFNNKTKNPAAFSNIYFAIYIYLPSAMDLYSDLAKFTSSRKFSLIVATKV